MSEYTDRLTAQMLGAANAARPPSAPNPVQATITSATIDPTTGARTITVGYQGAKDIPVIWSDNFDVVIQVITGGTDLSKLKGVEVMVVTTSSPPFISGMIVRG